MASRARKIRSRIARLASRNAAPAAGPDSIDGFDMRRIVA
jgi:hypothetical protein